MHPMQKAMLKFMLNYKWTCVCVFLMAGSVMYVYRAEFSLGSSTLETIILVTSIGAVFSAGLLATIPTHMAREVFPELRSKPSFKPVGVNEPCPCGSGNKFKKCCMKNG